MNLEGRDRSVDALRALAILGVVLGHWLVTAFVLTDGEYRVVSPLNLQPELTPVSWVLQTLAVFFLVGGYAGTRSLDSARRSGTPYHSWLLARMTRLLRPVAVLLVFWTLVGFSSFQGIVLSPLWFILVYAGLVALTPLVVACPRHLAVAGVAVVAAADLARFAAGGPAWLGWANVLAGWLVPYCIGAAWARGARLPAGALLVGGVVATFVLVRWCGYPASMVGVPGDGRSNLDPPSLAAVAFGLAQVGLALLLRGPLTRLTRRAKVWFAVVVVNVFAMTIFLWHQTALIAVTTFGAGYGRLPGLHTAPDSPLWVLNRLAWLPVFAAALALFVALFHRFDPVAASAFRGLRNRERVILRS